MSKSKVKTTRRHTITALAACRFYAAKAGAVRRYTKMRRKNGHEVG